MWIKEIYSFGDMHSDTYLVSYDEDDNEIAKFSDIDFLSSYAVDLDECIRRLEEERSILEKYGTRLIGKKSWADIVEQI